ncbi:MAG: L-histidine N(alpha)-methyltransferase [Pseudomonadota bacterium]|nr:MAG: L-histidine N(alpha)-methyltransferase [Pseudomonadota bacterium]
MTDCTQNAALPLRDQHPAPSALTEQLIAGLSEDPKRVSSLYLYDERGSRLFERICTLPEYYLTRTEIAILDAHGDDIAARIGPDALLVEFGSGASLKTRLLLDRLVRPCAYVPVDIARAALLEAARSITRDYPGLEVLPVCADFMRPFDLPEPRRPAQRSVVFFPGSTIGNFDEPDAIALLERMRQVAGTGGGLVIGTDLVKDVSLLKQAYDDAAGVTAEFNRNVLLRLNREFGAGFVPEAFRHEAVWSDAHSRIEMHLVSLRKQSVEIDGTRIAFLPGERLVTEHCHKYTLAGFAALAAVAGWRVDRAWTDPRGWFGVQYLEPASV